MPRYTDAHTHLEKFSAAKSDLSAVALNAARESEWKRVMALAKRKNSAGVSIFPQFGIHPWYVSEAEPGWPQRLEDTLRTALELNLPGVGVGEIGLDRLKAADEIQWQQQLDAFRLQFRLACRLNLPVSIHTVHCWDVMQQEIYGMLATKPRFGKPAAIIFHNYLSSPEIVGQFLAWEQKDRRNRPPCYFSFSPDILAGNRQKVWEAAKVVPRDRILAETDTHPGRKEERIFCILFALSILQEEGSITRFITRCEKNMLHAFCPSRGA